MPEDALAPAGLAESEGGETGALPSGVNAVAGIQTITSPFAEVVVARICVASDLGCRPFPQKPGGKLAALLAPQATKQKATLQQVVSFLETRAIFTYQSSPALRQPGQHDTVHCLRHLNLR